MNFDKFPKDFWKETQSSIEFIPTNLTPKNICFTAIKMFIFRNEKILLTKVPRGWDIPTGHIEKDETLIETARRETKEETGAKLIKTQFIGYLKLLKLKENEENKRYPKISAIAIFLSTDFKLGPLENKFEATDRKLQKINSVQEIHHNWTELMESIMRYAYFLSKNYDKEKNNL